ncbi:MAG: TetR/AcrR family transcriptional regulator [Anaerolineales bacterium]|nr:TetR/AcrR family transcriptional regulator [Anaerolineales bacterium]
MARSLKPERRTEFLDAALKLFVEKGVARTSTAEIAREAGSAAGTLFLYFPTKQDLIDALILRVAREQSEHINGLLSPALSTRDSFWTIWEGSLRWFLDHPEAYSYARQVRDTRTIGEKAVRESEGYFRYYFAAVQQGLQERQIKPYPIELVGGMLYQQIVGVMSLIGPGTSPAKREEYIRSGFEIFWNGIRSNAADESGTGRTTG